MKRLSSTGQFAFNYDQPTSSPLTLSNDAEVGAATANEDSNSNEKDEPDEPYVRNPLFLLPPYIEIPETMKVHAIIEKTAKFIASQGTQMEILIKAKQANNPLFEFLNHDSRLKPYYKHMLQTMKDGLYPDESKRPVETNKNPSFMATSSNYDSGLISVPTIKYKPSADCAYTQLISKIKGVPIEMADRVNTPSPNLENQSTNGKPQSVPKTEVVVKKISSALMLAQCYGSGSEDDEENDEKNASETKFVNKNNLNINEDSQTSEPAIDDNVPIPSGIECPTPERRTIIDKTAAYVLKNGKYFEEILRSKNDERFSFLNYTDRYHKYYSFKVTGAVSADMITSKTECNEKMVNKTSTELTQMAKVTRMLKLAYD